MAPSCSVTPVIPCRRLLEPFGTPEAGVSKEAELKRTGVDFLQGAMQAMWNVVWRLYVLIVTQLICEVSAC